MSNKLVVKGEGVPDFVLMDQLTEDAMYQNITIRFPIDRIYTYIGSVVVSVNPYKSVPNMYGAKQIESYKGRYMYEMPPHIYALANDVYRSMMHNLENQCVIISGESGAGKTEASKYFMQYIAAVSKSGAEVTRVKDQLLCSNPVLEAFGNAKTLRNDNSSRFGKYMEIQFEAGAPVGGKINIYLLEKSRVVIRAQGERAFHIFYQLIAGSDQGENGRMSLGRDANKFEYLKKSQCTTVPSINDSNDFHEVNQSLDILGFSGEDKKTMWSILAGILHLGNVNFSTAAPGAAKTGESKTNIANPADAEKAATLWSCDANLLKKALVNRSINTGVGRRASTIQIPLDQAQAVFTRDALSKAVYERLFSWLVDNINSRLNCTSPGNKLVIGILDIYGFEVFQNNSFEQFCINLCNEKLQQLFIELTLKSEQEEYVKEGIQWQPIKYFNNKIICDLIEAKMGVIALLDECCLIAESTDVTWLNKMNTVFKDHPHYQSYAGSKDRTIGDTHFRLKHYAGDVTYNVDGFLEKNKDTLYIDLSLAMQSSKNQVLLSLFPPVDVNSKKRPVTAATQFKTALGALMEKLLSCTPHYIRCIKPNDDKRPGMLDETRVRHQIRYLGLVENVRVRRAGFAFRMTYDRFMRRYKFLDEKTWPHWSGDDKSGTQQILNAHRINAEEYRMGKTKIFIRNPTTLFYFEEKREEYLPNVIVLMQAAVRGYVERSKWTARKAAITIQLAFRASQFRHWFSTIHQAFSNIRQDSQFGKNTPFPQVPAALDKAVNMLHLVLKNWRCHKMVNQLSAEDQAHMRQKIMAYNIFHGKKPWAYGPRFEADYLDRPTNPTHSQYQKGMQNLFAKYGDQQVLFADFVNKANRVGKVQKRGLVVTEANIYKHDAKTYSVVKFGTPIVEVTKILMSRYKDSYIVVQCKGDYRDLVIDMGLENGHERYSEFVTILIRQYKQLTGGDLPIEFVEKINYNNSRKKGNPGKDCVLVFQPSTDPKLQGAMFKNGKNNENIIVFRN